MEENKNTNFGELEKLALIAESVQTIFSVRPRGAFRATEGA